MIEAAVEEFLRYDGHPSNSLCRMVAVDHEIGGRRLAAETGCFCMLNSGNRDERAFPDPDRLDITRNPRGHLTFGQGIPLLHRRAARPASRRRSASTR